MAQRPQLSRSLRQEGLPILPSSARIEQPKGVNEAIPGYGFLGTTPGLNRSERSLALTASPRSGPTRKISCIVRKSEECV